jgi:hypothetical protein
MPWRFYSLYEQNETLKKLLRECIPLLHTGDELPVSHYVKNAPNCLLARVAEAVNYEENCNE